MSSPADKKPERKPVVRAHNLSLGRYSVTDAPTEESPYEKPSRPSSWPPPPASGVHERVARASDRPPAPRTPSTPPAAMRVREDRSERRIAEVEPIVAPASRRAPSVTEPSAPTVAEVEDFPAVPSFDMVPTLSPDAHAAALARLEPPHVVVETAHGIFVSSPSPEGFLPIREPRRRLTVGTALLTLVVLVVAAFGALVVWEMAGR